MNIILLIAAVVVLAATTAAVRRQRNRDADNAAARLLFRFYRDDVDALTTAYLHDAPSDEEWLDGIKAQASVLGGSRQDEPALDRRPLPTATPRRPKPDASLALYSCLLLFAVGVAGAALASQYSSGALAMTAVLAGTAGYFISLRIHPLRKCPVCKMTGRHFGSTFSYSYRRCRKCSGTGRTDRWGTQVFFGGTDHSGIYTKK